MSDLNPDARRLIKIARGGDLPSQADKERLRAALAARIASPDAAPDAASPDAAPAPSPAPPAPPPASLAPLSAALPLKGALVGGLLGGAALVTFLAARPAPAPLAVSSALIAATASVGAVSAPVPEVVEPAAPVAAVTAAPAVSASGAPRTSEPTGPDGRSAAPRPSAPAVDTLQQELALLAQAKEALGRGDLSAAREALSQHQQRYPRSSFAQEREVLFFLIACRAGQASAVKPQVRAFLTRNPRSPYAVPLRTACGEPEE